MCVYVYIYTHHIFICSSLDGLHHMVFPLFRMFLPLSFPT